MFDFNCTFGTLVANIHIHCNLHTVYSKTINPRQLTQSDVDTFFRYLYGILSMRVNW